MLAVKPRFFGPRHWEFSQSWSRTCLNRTIQGANAGRVGLATSFRQRLIVPMDSYFWRKRAPSPGFPESAQADEKHAILVTEAALSTVQVSPTKARRRRPWNRGRFLPIFAPTDKMHRHKQADMQGRKFELDAAYPRSQP